MKPPIIVQAEDEVLVFESREAAERYAEHYDVEAGVYKAAFDAEGKLLHFRVQGKASFWRVPKVVLAEDENSPGNSEDLRRVLVRALGSATAEYSLPELVQEAFRRFREP